MKVKRAAPGGEGRCINPFSIGSLKEYLAQFDAALNSLPRGSLRSHFHDSFEYAADWSPDVLKEFKSRRGYDLAEHLPAFGKHGDKEEIARVRTDYRTTISEMLLENFTKPWTEWAHSNGSLTRNQAHGSPGNWLDLYGAVDIPETEVFRSIGDARISKFASSAAHVMGKKLISAETATWQSEHFTETLADTKRIIDRLFVAGINHIIYHGTAYSPSKAKWPGWLFYASANFSSSNPAWRDFPALNKYVTRCQSILQSGKPDNDILLYWPIHDMWMHQPNLFGLTIEGKWLDMEPIGKTSRFLWEHGYSFDYVSDAQLGLATVKDGRVVLPGGTYKTIVVPYCKYIDEQTLITLVALGVKGAKIILEDPNKDKDFSWEEHGFFPRRFITAPIGSLLDHMVSGAWFPPYGYGGRFIRGTDLPQQIRESGVHPSSWCGATRNRNGRERSARRP